MSVERAGTAHPQLRAALIAALDERAPRVDRDRVAACFDFAAFAACLAPACLPAPALLAAAPFAAVAFG